MRTPTAAGWVKPALFLLCLVPAIDLAHGAWTNTLGVNPLETLTRSTGTWTLRFLLLTLLITPLIRVMRAPALLRYRRMLGLFAFFYALSHLGTYLWFDKFFDWQEIWLDIQDRLFITAGVTAFLLLVPLALTSTRRAQRALGNAWNRLHRLDLCCDNRWTPALFLAGQGGLPGADHLRVDLCRSHAGEDSQVLYRQRVWHLLIRISLA